MKSLSTETHIKDLARASDIFREYKMKLNQAKCTFGVEEGKCLGFMISKRGIEVNPEKVQALQGTEAPKKQKDIQKLKGRIAALKHFVSKLAKRCLPFFKAHKKANKFT